MLTTPGKLGVAIWNGAHKRLALLMPALDSLKVDIAILPEAPK
jgi:hypothetical protein